MSSSITYSDIFYVANLTAADRNGQIQSSEDLVTQLRALNTEPIATQIVLEASDLVINDRYSGVQIERVPYNNMAHVRHHVTDGKDKLSRLAMFVVNDTFNLVPPEFYIFSFHQNLISPQEFVSKLNLAINAKLSKPRPPVANKPLRNSVNMEEEAQRAANLTIKFREKQPNKLVLPWMNQGVPNQQNGDVVTVKPDDYLNILNHCFDDIETFIIRLQSAAEAYKELERRRETRKGVAGQGDGMLIFRSQPPPRDDFVSILQKIKLNLNLLPKLKGQVKNPNAPEMAHYIFNPLEFICEASTTVVQGQRQMLAERVITPLFTPETLQFLGDCLVSKEMDFLKSLGPGWNINSGNIEYWSNFATELPVYTPVFFDGWSPPESWLLEIAPRLDLHKLQQPVLRNNINRNIEKTQSVIRSSMYTDNLSKRQSMLTKQASNPSYSPADSGQQEEFRQQIGARGGTIYRAIYDWVAKKDTELDISNGDYVEVLEVHVNWCKVKNISGLIGFLPNNVIKLIENNSTNTALSGPTTNPSEYEFEKIYSDPVNTKLNNLNSEFAQKVRVSDDKGREVDIPKRKAKEQTATLTDKSTPADVANWLQSKDFSIKVQQALGELSGKELFKQEKNHLEKLFGSDEGNRLFSQILVQRRLSGNETVRAQELSKILNKRKNKADDSLFVDPSTAANASDESQLSNHF